MQSKIVLPWRADASPYLIATPCLSCSLKLKYLNLNNFEISLSTLVQQQSRNL